jgi:hypothetical protein
MNDDRNAPATKGDIDDLHAEIVATLRDIQAEMVKGFDCFSGSSFPNHPSQ